MSMSKEYQRKWEREFYKKNPWLRNYKQIKFRCSEKWRGGAYFKRGIKFLLTKEDMKNLWHRDEAYDLKKPSLDRIDNEGDYKFSNCRFIEVAENSQRPKTRVGKSNPYVGVHFDKSRNKWHATLCTEKNKERKSYHLGRFIKLEDAIKASKKAREKLFN